MVTFFVAVNFVSLLHFGIQTEMCMSLSCVYNSSQDNFRDFFIWHSQQHRIQLFFFIFLSVFFFIEHKQILNQEQYALNIWGAHLLQNYYFFLRH